MSIGVRRLTLLGEFKPFGLIAEALDGKSAETVTENYEYFLFDPEIARDRDAEDHCDEVASALNNRGDHELFIRGKRIIWSIDARVFKRFTMQSSIVKVCWCHLGHTAEALLCILQIDRLTIYNTSGEVVSVQLPRTVTSIWPLPFGLLLQQEVEASTSSRVSFSSTSPLLSSRDVLLSASNHIQKRDGSLVSSHLILMDPLDEQQPTFIEERGKLNVMKEYDEKTIWTSDQVPLMASYNKGKMQHSLWVAEVINSNFDEAASGLLNVDPTGLSPKHLSFRRIWQGKGAQIAACKVFMATGDDAAPVVCFFHQEQRKLLSVSLQTVEINNEIVYDVKPDMSWIIAAVAASPVMVTRPRVKIGLLPYSDIVVLTPENALLLYSGKQCLCRFVLPSCLNKDKILHDLELPETSSLSNALKITGLMDAVEGRVNVIVNNKQMFRCALRQSPSSSLANDCITALAEGIGSSFYRHFLGLLWKDDYPTDFSEAESNVDSEWDSFCRVIMKICRKSNTVSQKHSGLVPQRAWNFLLSSQFHNNFCKVNSFFGKSFVVPLDQLTSSSSTSSIGATCPSTLLFSFGVVDKWTEHDKTLQCTASETAEAGIGGVHKAFLSDLMSLQLSGNDIPQISLHHLIYPNRTFYISKPLLDIFQDSALSSKITAHPDGQVTFMGTEVEMKDFLALVTESCLSESTHKGEKQFMLVPHFSRMNVNEVESRSHSSTLDIHSTLTVPLKSPEKVKIKPSRKKNQKVVRERDLFKKNYIHACESLLFLMTDKSHHRETAILSLKKSGPELPELLTQFSAGIAGTGLAVVLSVICKLACGRVPFCASKVFNTGLGFGLVWLSWGVNKLRNTIVNISKNTGKMRLKDKDMIQKVDESLKEVYFRAAALLVVAVLRLA